MMEVAPRDGGNYIPQVIQYLTGVNLVEYSVRMAMGEPVQPPEEASVNGFASYFAAHSANSGILDRIAISDEVRIVEEFSLKQPCEEVRKLT